MFAYQMQVHPRGSRKYRANRLQTPRQHNFRFHFSRIWSGNSLPPPKLALLIKFPSYCKIWRGANFFLFLLIHLKQINNYKETLCNGQNVIILSSRNYRENFAERQGKENSRRKTKWNLPLFRERNNLWPENAQTDCVICVTCWLLKYWNRLGNNELTSLAPKLF